MIGHRRLGRGAWSRQDRAGRRRAPRRASSSAVPPPHGRSGRAAARPDLRLLVRRVPRRHRATCASSTARSAGHEDPAAGQRRYVRGGAARRLHAEADAVRTLSAGRGRLLHREHQEGLATCDRRHDHRRRAGPPVETLPGFRTIKPMVFAGLYPDERRRLRGAARRAREAAPQRLVVLFEPETSEALGFGFRCGFLGLLHMEIVQERLEREFDLDTDHDRADGALPGDARRTARSSRSTRPRSCRRRPRSQQIEEPVIARDDHDPRRVHRRRS